ncbi:PTC4 [[Candida] subhashii]|uniref:protein-serine/threonine phosphatase n=1 Tax=[Candida] subhashii TaxID=561895 RepID=A0A8J5QGB4_9ASCO|nr:PTC4 [[Candida] subhashii]KAG7661614.1 PTC4 [[Candida] subhashii]
MGQLLSHPIEDKQLDYKIHNKLSYCVGAMQGYRMTMEDAHDVKINEDESLAVFGVFDGHGGKQCSEYLAIHLPRLIFRELQKYKRKKASQLENSDPAGGNRSSGSGGNGNVIRIIRDCFFQIDYELNQNLLHAINCGSTAIISIMLDDRIYVANTGDSRCILSINGSAKTLSFDHKPSNMGERVRIENSNGYVLNSRINEILALSRAFGDFKFKLPFIDSSRNKYINENKLKLSKKIVHLPPELFQVTVEPDILIYDIKNVYTPPPEFLVIACDGIWDCFKNNQLVKLIRDKLAFGWKLNRIVEYILNDCLTMANNYTGIGFDNMTLIIVAVHPQGGNMDDWYKMMIDKVLKEKNLM